MNLVFGIFFRRKLFLSSILSQFVLTGQIVHLPCNSNLIANFNIIQENHSKELWIFESTNLLILPSFIQWSIHIRVIRTPKNFHNQRDPHNYSCKNPFNRENQTKNFRHRFPLPLFLGHGPYNSRNLKFFIFQKPILLSCSFTNASFQSSIFFFRCNIDVSIDNYNN